MKNLVLTLAIVAFCTVCALAAPTIMGTDRGLNAGDRVVVGAKPILCFDTTDALGSFAQAVSVGDTIGERQIASEHTLLVSPGDRLLVIDASTSPVAVGAMRFRITNGANAGAACWLPGTVPMSTFVRVLRAR
jgi:hypothetical protein